MFKAAWAILAAAGITAYGQTPADAKPKVDKASSYYHYALAHMYAELASTYGVRGGYLDKAIDNYKEAIAADPDSPVLTEELSELYIGSGRLREAQSDAEEALKKNPNDLAAHRLLARVFTSQIGDQQRNRIDESMAKKAIEQYQKISELDPKDVDTLVMLGRLQKLAQNSVEAEKAYKRALAIDPDSEDALTGLALVYGDLGNSTEAARMLKQLSDKSPSAKSLRALAATYEQMKEYALAAQALQRALELNPPDAGDLKRALAEDQTQAKDYDAALKTYQDLVSDDPSDAQSFLSMSRIYRTRHDLAKARAMSEKAKTLEPYNIEVRYNEVGILEAEGKPADAIKAMKELVASTEKRSYSPREKEVRSELLDELAQMYLGADQTEAAVGAYHQIAELDPDKGPAVSASVIEAYRQGKDFQKAQAESDAAVKQYPADSGVHAAHALLLADAGKVDAAAAEVKKFLGPGSDAAGKGGAKADRGYYTTLAQVYDKGHKYDEESKALDAAEKLSESNREKMLIWASRGAMYEKMGKIDGSEAEFRKILQTEPDNAQALNYLGYILADRGIRLNEALQMVTKAVEQDPGNGAYLDSLGWVYYKLGKLPEAEENIRKALETQPRDATVRDHLGDVLLKESKVREAVAQWEISLKEWNSTSPADIEPDKVAQVKTKLEGARVRLAQEGKQQ